MRPPPPPPAFSRRSFILFALLAPASLLAVAAIVGVLQYRQFRSMVSPTALVDVSAQTPTDDARVENLLDALSAFSRDEGPDTLAFSPEDLTLLASASPVAARQGIRFRIVAADSLLASESSRRVDALEGRFAGLFKRISPMKNGWLNARVEGLPEWKSGALALAPERGFLNGIKVPRAALVKRSGLSPKDFLDSSAAPDYAAFLAALDTVMYREGKVVLVRAE